MREKPDLSDEKIVSCLRDEYGLRVNRVDFLPMGADRNSSVYRVAGGDGSPYFLKLRSGVFDEISVTLPKFLSDQGIAQIIAPLPTKAGRLWAALDEFKTILYPFVEGRNGYDLGLLDGHFIELGTSLKSIHTIELPQSIVQRVPRETYSPHWRETVKTFLKRIEDGTFGEHIAEKTAAFLNSKRDEVLDLVGRAERLAEILNARRAQEFILCHTDIHARNILIGADDAFYIVDWDAPILAPKERDLMFIGGGLMGRHHTPQEEERFFYQGYGQTEIDSTALAYYRYERIVVDIAEYCEQIFLTNEGGEDRDDASVRIASNFLPNGVLEIAYASDRTSVVSDSA